MEVNALIDSGSSDSFIHPAIVDKLKISVKESSSTVSMASGSLKSTISGYVNVNFTIEKNQYANIKLNVMDNLCMDVILGLDFQKQHESVTLKLGGKKPALLICGLSSMSSEPPSLFSNLSVDCKPIAAKSRRYNCHDRKFITQEIDRMLKDDIIERSNSSWRSQVLVTKDEHRKKRLVMDYSQTINKYTELDAYPLPRIDDYVNDLAKYNYFSKIDLKSAYHQVSIREEDKKFTAFEANGGLYQLKRMPFGVTNGVPCFQRIMDEFVKDERLDGTHPFMDDIVVAGFTKEEHDANLLKFRNAADKKNLTYNPDKCVFGVTKLCTVGHIIENQKIRPDPERLRPLREIPVPSDPQSMKRVVGMFSYYSKWIPKFSDKIAPLVKNTTYPVSEHCEQAFQQLKTEVENSVVSAIDESLPFELETDASDLAIAAVLNQNGRPVAFFSRTLQDAERRHSPVEKEATAIIESVRHWRHYLSRHFKLITDQQGLSFVFNKRHKNKIKNDKVARWKMELSCYSFDVVHRKGELNVPADTFSRIYCSMMSTESLVRLHQGLCHPGITRMNAFVKSRNLPFSLDDIRKVNKACKICCECKPQFFKPESAKLIKATHSWERLNIDFKGPIPSSTRNHYMLTVVDEFSRFPFAFACPDTTTKTVISCLDQLFSIFGLPGYIHSDRGSCFMSDEFKKYLLCKGIASSRTSPYNPRCNGQTERYNGTIMKSVQLALRQNGLEIKAWERVLPDALHAIRSLISTATMETPHERMLHFQRRSLTGHAVPTWLSQPGPVLLKRHVRQSKYEPLVDRVHLLEANPQYAHIRFPNGRESTVSLRHLAPVSTVESRDHCSNQQTLSMPSEPVNQELYNDDTSVQEQSVEPCNLRETQNETTVEATNDTALNSKPPLRRSPRLAAKQAAEARD